MVGCNELVQSRRRFPLLVIDEAHLLPAGDFEQFRLLLSDQMDSPSTCCTASPTLSTTLPSPVSRASSFSATTVWVSQAQALMEAIGDCQRKVINILDGSVYQPYPLLDLPDVHDGFAAVGE